MNFSEQLDKFVERGAEKYFKDKFEYFNGDWEGPMHAHKDGAASLKPIVLKLVDALRKYRTQSCSSQNIDMAANETLSELSQMLEGGSK